jgi:hypothetical protein
MSVTFPLEARVFAKVTPRWAKRAAWLAAILAVSSRGRAPVSRRR